MWEFVGSSMQAIGSSGTVMRAVQGMTNGHDSSSSGLAGAAFTCDGATVAWELLQQPMSAHTPRPGAASMVRLVIPRSGANNWRHARSSCCPSLRSQIHIDRRALIFRLWQNSLASLRQFEHTRRARPAHLHGVSWKHRGCDTSQKWAGPSRGSDPLAQA